MEKPLTRCIATDACTKRARFYVSNEHGLRLRCCGKHLVKVVVKFRKPISRGHSTLFLQRYKPNA